MFVCCEKLLKLNEKNRRKLFNIGMYMMLLLKNSDMKKSRNKHILVLTLPH
jgi:hypothetical protein